MYLTYSIFSSTNKNKKNFIFYFLAFHYVAFFIVPSIKLSTKSIVSSLQYDRQTWYNLKKNQMTGDNYIQSSEVALKCT